MQHFLGRPSSLYVLFCFFCFAFILIFYDGYRNIQFVAENLSGQNPQASFSVHFERAVERQYEQFMEEIDFFHDRKSVKGGDLDQRHKLRWLYKTAESWIYKALAPISIRAALYAKYIHYSIVLLITLIFIALTTERLRGGLDFSTLSFLAFGVYAYVALVSTSHRMYDQHSFIETATVAAGIYFSLRRNLWVFLIVLAIGVTNRETGSALGVVYALINWRERLFWVPVVAGPLFLMTINADLLLLPDLYRLENYIVTPKSTVGYIHIFNLLSVPFSLIAFSAIKLFAFLSPVFVFFPKAVKCQIGQRLLTVGAIYLFMLLFGTILGYLFPYAMLIPVIFALWAVTAAAPADAAKPCGAI